MYVFPSDPTSTSLLFPLSFSPSPLRFHWSSLNQSLQQLHSLTPITALSDTGGAMEDAERSSGQERLRIGGHVQRDWRWQSRMNKARCTCDQMKRRTPRLGKQRADKKHNRPDNENDNANSNHNNHSEHIHVLFIVLVHGVMQASRTACKLLRDSLDRSRIWK